VTQPRLFPGIDSIPDRQRIMIWLGMLLLSSLLPAATVADSKSIKVDSIHPRIEILTFNSDVLHKPMSLCVIFPEVDRKPGADKPVLFWLHGRGRTCRSLVDDPVARKELLNTQNFIVFLQGDDGWYINSPVRKKERYESSTTDAIDLATTHYQLSSKSEHRGICGWSMGGYGAVRYSVMNPDQFGTVCSIIGLLDFPKEGFPEGQSYSIPKSRFGTDPATWERLNPLHRSSALKGKRLLIISADQAFDRTMNENFHHSLTSQEIPHEWIMLQGGHTFEVVRAAVPLVVNFANRSLGK